MKVPDYKCYAYQLKYLQHGMPDNNKKTYHLFQFSSHHHRRSFMEKNSDVVDVSHYEFRKMFGEPYLLEWVMTNDKWLDVTYKEINKDR